MPRNRGPIPPGWVKLLTLGNPSEAELFSAVLATEDIPSQVFGANTSAVDWFYQMFNDVDLIVMEADVDRARQVLAAAKTDAVEPAQEPAEAPPPKDEQGNPLVPVDGYERVADLRDAQVILASSQIDSYGPRLVLRGEKPAGTGKRFVLRVAENDLERAREILAEEADEDDGEPRCPKCGSWQVVERKGVLGSLASLVGAEGRSWYECHSCHYRGHAGEFLNHSN